MPIRHWLTRREDEQTTPRAPCRLLEPASGEEFECAQALDMLLAVGWWVRNLERQPAASFWLPTASTPTS